MLGDAGIVGKSLVGLYWVCRLISLGAVVLAPGLLSALLPSLSPSDVLGFLNRQGCDARKEGDFFTVTMEIRDYGETGPGSLICGDAQGNEVLPAL